MAINSINWFFSINCEQPTNTYAKGDNSEKLKFIVAAHFQYNSDLAPTDKLFKELKEAIRIKHFSTDDDVEIVESN